MASEIRGAVSDRGPRTRGERHLLSELADIAGAEGMAWPRISTLASRCCVSEKTIERGLKKLEREGWIRVERKAPARLLPDFAGREHFAQGKQSLYVIDLHRLGLTPETKPKLFARQKFSPDILSGESGGGELKYVQNEGASPRASGDDSEAFEQVGGDSFAVESADILSGDFTDSPDICGTTHPTFATDSPDKSDRLTRHLRSDTVGRTGRTGRTGKEQLAKPLRSTRAIPGDPVTAEARRVMAELQCTDPSLLPLLAVVLRAALGVAQRQHPEEKEAAIADAMIAAWREYSGLGEFLRYTWGMQKFFTHGHWTNSDGWPLDMAALRQRREARVGMR